MPPPPQPSSSSSPQTVPGLPFGKNGNPTLFAKWAKNREIFLHPDVAFLIPTKTMGLGVYAARPLPKGSTVVSCPLSASISPYEKPCAESACLAVLHQVTPPVSPLLVVCLRLLEAVGRPNHPWKPWLEGCPLMPDHLFHLAPALDCTSSNSDSGEDEFKSSLRPFDSERCRAFASSLLGAPAVNTDSSDRGSTSWSNAAQSLRSLDVTSLWQQALAVMSQHPSIWPQKPCLSFDTFCHILSQVYSRNFHREEVEGHEGPYLLPGVDFVNHDAALTNASFQIHGGGRSRGLTFDVITTKDLQKGEQVYYNYGEIEDGRFVVEFQFIPSQNLCDSLRFSFETLEAICTEVRLLHLISNSNNKKQQSVETQGSEESKEGTLKENARAEIRERIATLHKLDLLSKDGIFVQGEALFTKRVAQSMPHAKKRENTAVSSVSVNDAAFFRGVEQHYWNIVYLLCCAESVEFRTLQTKLSHHWTCSKGTPGLMEAVRATFSLRRDRVQENVRFATEVLAERSTATAGAQSDVDRSYSDMKTTTRAIELLKATLGREVTLLDDLLTGLK